jgi:hypothetical protein
MREGPARIITAAGFRIVVSTSAVHELHANSLAQRRFNLPVINAGHEPGAAIARIRRPAPLASRFSEDRSSERAQKNPGNRNPYSHRKQQNEGAANGA